MPQTSPSPNESDIQKKVRNVAINHHHDVADTFKGFYNAPDRFVNAFNYGRHKVDRLMDAELKRLPAGARILDIGCGTGEYLKRVTRLGFSAVGVEPAVAMRDYAQAENPELTIVDGVTTALPFEDNAFDFLLSLEVLRYLHGDDVQLAMREMLRVLKPGGRALITFVNRYAWDGFYFLQRGRQVWLGEQFTRKHPHCEFTTPHEVTSALENVGALVETHGVLFAPMRIAYKLHPKLGAAVARRFEVVDDLIQELPAMKPFAGHLVAVATKPVAQ